MQMQPSERRHAFSYKRHDIDFLRHFRDCGSNQSIDLPVPNNVLSKELRPNHVVTDPTMLVFTPFGVEGKKVNGKTAVLRVIS